MFSLLDLLQQAHVFHVLRTLELGAVLQVGSHSAEQSENITSFNLLTVLLFIIELELEIFLENLKFENIFE